MAISGREANEVEAANAGGKTPVVFIHGLWLLASSWDNWAGLFAEAGYAPVAVDWPTIRRRSRRHERIPTSSPARRLARSATTSPR